MTTAWRERFGALYQRFRHRGKTIELSFSRLQTYSRCPWLYHLVYNEGWRAGPKGNMALGLSLHRALAEYMTPGSKERSVNRLLEIYDQVWVNEGYATTQETLDAYDNGRKMLEHYAQSDLARKSRVVATEATFRVNFEGIDLWGTVDRIDQAPDGFYEVIEYKTQGDNWSAARRENDLQMTLYEWGVRQGLGFSPLRLKYHFLSSGEVVEVQRTEAQREEAMALLKKTARELRQENFQPNTSYCSKCEFGKRCVNYEETTLDH
jgi:DNA helicase-2/ATP-dependent DNA helicase PcrA